MVVFYKEHWYKFEKVGYKECLKVFIKEFYQYLFAIDKVVTEKWWIKRITKVIGKKENLVVLWRSVDRLLLLLSFL